MGSKNKLKRFKENETFKNVFQPSRDELVNRGFALKGNWDSIFFKNNNPLVIELGCGKGEYTVDIGQWLTITIAYRADKTEVTGSLQVDKLAQ